MKTNRESITSDLLQLSEEAIQALREVDRGETTTYASADDFLRAHGIA